MKKQKQNAKKPTLIVLPVGRAPYWEVFFRQQRSPLLRSQLITAVMAGKQFETDRLPKAALADAVLLSMAARNYVEAEIVDDYPALLRRTDETWKEPDWTCKVFDQSHTGTVDFIVRGVTTTRFTCAEDAPIPGLVEWLLDHDCPDYFAEELAA